MSLAKSLEMKVRLIVVSVLVVLLLQSVFIYRQINLVQEGITHDIEVVGPTVQTLNELKFNIVQVQQWLTDISATRGLDGLNDGLDQAETHATKVRDSIVRLKALVALRSDELDIILRHFEQFKWIGKHRLYNHRK